MEKQVKALAALVGITTILGIFGGMSFPEVTSPTHVVETGTNVFAKPIFHEPITLAVYGDSISAWNGTTPIVGGTWTQDMSKGPVIVNTADGFAHGGFNISEIDANAHRSTSDYVVIMAGVNDLGSQRWATPQTSMIASLENIVTKTGLPANRIIISAVAPADQGTGWPATWNSEEASLSAVQGWHFIDPWAGIRSATGGYIQGLTIEGVHPNAAGSRILADNIAAEVESIND